MPSSVREIEQDVGTLDAVKGRPTLEVSASSGRGHWAGIPWIALLEEQGTTTTQKGVYPRPPKGQMELLDTDA